MHTHSLASFQHGHRFLGERHDLHERRTWLVVALTAVIALWSLGLMRSAAAVLVDAVPNGRLAAMARERLDAGHDRVADLHLWRLGPGHVALVAVVVADLPLPEGVYRERLAGIPGLSHVTIEVQQSPGHENPEHTPEHLAAA